MPRKMGNGILKVQRLAKLTELCVLSLFKWVTFEALKLYAYGVIVAMASAPILRLSCMPSAVVDADKLPKCAVASNIKVSRHLQAPDLREIGVSVPVQLVGEQRLNFVASILTGWQADRVNHHQINTCTVGAQSKIWRVQSYSLMVPTAAP